MLIKKMAIAYSSATGADSPEYYERYYLDFSAHADAIYSVGNKLGITAADKVLEIGSGLGTRCLLGNAIHGANFVGLEPCANTYTNLKDAILIFKSINNHITYEVKYATGENSGFDSNTFDKIVSFEVIEHVKDPVGVINEMYRILKPAGTIFISSCNYNSIYEGHYRSLLIPIKNKRFQKTYLKIINRNPDFMDEINFITKSELFKQLEQAGFEQIKFHCNFEITHYDGLASYLPHEYKLNNESCNAKLIQKLVQSRIVNNILSKVNREYKLYVTAVKPIS